MKEKTCLTSLLVPVVIVVVLNVQPLMGSAWNIGGNGTTDTTGNDVEIRNAATPSTPARLGDDYVIRSSQIPRYAKAAKAKDASLRRTPSITERRSNSAVIRGTGTTCNHSAGHVIRANPRRKDRDGDVPHEARRWSGEQQTLNGVNAVVAMVAMNPVNVMNEMNANIRVGTNATIRSTLAHKRTERNTYRGLGGMAGGDLNKSVRRDRRRRAGASCIAAN
jgi:hypothetical protein